MQTRDEPSWTGIDGLGDDAKVVEYHAVIESVQLQAQTVAKWKFVGSEKDIDRKTELQLCRKTQQLFAQLWRVFKTHELARPEPNKLRSGGVRQYGVSCVSLSVITCLSLQL